MSKQYSNNALIFILITICLDTIGLGIIIPSFPKLVAEVAHVSLEESSKYAGPVMMTYALTQFLFSPLIGNLSDRFGRRPILLISIFGLGIDYVFMIFAPTLMWLIIGRLIAGMFGASFTTAAAYIADISNDANRARNFGFIGAAFGLGFIIGPAIGGLVAHYGTRAPFVVASLFSLANFLYGLLVLKESLPADQRRPFSWLRSNPLGSLLQLKRYKATKWLFLVTFLVMLSNMAIHNVWNYYTESKFGWTPAQVGLSLAVVGVCIGAIQAGFSGFLVKKLGPKGAGTLGVGILAFTTLAIGLATKGWLMYVLFLPYALSGITDPSIRSVVSSKTAMNEQGELQGIFTSLMSLAEVLGPLIMLELFYTSLPHAQENPLYFGTPYFLAAIIAVFSLLLLRWAFNKSDEDETVNPGALEEIPEKTIQPAD